MTCYLVLGTGHCTIASTLAGSGLKCSPPTLCPRYNTSAIPTKHLVGFNVSPASLILASTAATCTKCESHELLKTAMSSRYALANPCIPSSKRLTRR
ncbi:hypothetical protein FKM82_020251 [Ascaphus truei]